MNNDLEKVKGFKKLTPRRKEIFKNVFAKHNACLEDPKDKKEYKPVKVEAVAVGVKVTFKNKSWLNYCENGNWY